MILIIYFITILFIGVWIWNRKNKFALNEESLHKQWLFWLAILFPLFSSLYFMLTLGFSYPPNIDIDGFNNFLNMHKFSLGILTLSPILGAFVVSAHRSIQTAKQIEATERKNKVDIYISTRKYNYELLELVKDNKNRKIKHIDSLYNKAFISKKPYHDDINIDFYIDINKLFAEIDISLNELNDIYHETNSYYNKDIFDLIVVQDFIDYTRDIIKYIKKIESYIFLDEVEIFKYDILNYIHDNLINEKKETYLIAIDDISKELTIIIQTINKIVNILLPEKNPHEYLPNLIELESTNSDICNMILEKKIGGKVATENQNNHE